jgi:hypothetical protein
MLSLEKHINIHSRDIIFLGKLYTGWALMETIDKDMDDEDNELQIWKANQETQDIQQHVDNTDIRNDIKKKIY